MNKKIYFISDIHLGLKDTKEERKKRKKLIEFLSKIEKDAKTLYILGDLFDFWFEWYHVIPKYFFPVFFQLKTLINSGVDIHLLAGNHDFYFHDYIKKSIGLKTYKESLEVKLGNKKFFLIHGDGCGKKDTGYRILKKIIRNPVSIFFFKTFISADLGIWLAKIVSKTSRGLKQIDKSTWLNEYFMEFAKKKFSEGFDYVIVGHIHYPKKMKVKEQELICCGDFISHFSYLEFDGKNLLLKNLR